MNILAFFRLRSHDVNLKFVTNTTKESKRCLMTRLHKIGFDIKPSELYTSLSAARHVIDKNNLRPMLMVDQRALEDFEGKQIFFFLSLLHMTIFIRDRPFNLQGGRGLCFFFFVHKFFFGQHKS